MGEYIYMLIIAGCTNQGCRRRRRSLHDSLTEEEISGQLNDFIESCMGLTNEIRTNWNVLINWWRDTLTACDEYEYIFGS